MSVLSWTSKRTTIVAAVVALAAAGVVASLALTGPAVAEGDDETVRGWPTHILADDATTNRQLSPQGRGDGETIRLRTREVRGAEVDVDGDGRFERGDYIVFEERLRQGGERVGRDSVECMLIARSFACEGTLRLNGRGSIEVAGSVFFKAQRFVLAVVGGTGQFNDASGKLTVMRRLVVELN